jgi:hypothetical protein
VKTSGSVAPLTTGNTNICSGMSSWKRVERRKSTNFRASASWRVPRRTPASSICRKHVPSLTPVGASAGFGSA